MKINNDCIRDLLLYLEDHLVFNEKLVLVKIRDNALYNAPELDSYSQYEITYNIQKLYEANLIDIAEIKTLSGYSFWVKDITYYGHEFLANIRNDNNWAKVKKIASKIGSSSLSALMQIASTVISESIKTL